MLCSSDSITWMTRKSAFVLPYLDSLHCFLDVVSPSFNVRGTTLLLHCSLNWSYQISSPHLQYFDWRVDFEGESWNSSLYCNSAYIPYKYPRTLTGWSTSMVRGEFLLTDKLDFLLRLSRDARADLELFFLSLYVPNSRYFISQFFFCLPSNAGRVRRPAHSLSYWSVRTCFFSSSSVATSLLVVSFNSISSLWTSPSLRRCWLTCRILVFVFPGTFTCLLSSLST